MRSLFAVLGAAVALAFATPASANENIGINPGNVPTTASGFGTHECSANQGGGPFAGYDVWVFNLPSGTPDPGVFVSVTAQFSTPGGDQSITIPTYSPSGIVLIGTSKAWVKLPAGWTLTGATAVISGSKDAKTQFVLTHTCPGTQSSPNASPSASAGASASASASASATPTPDPSVPGSPSVPVVTPSPDDHLPKTGTAVLGITTVGLLLVAGGAALIILQRRRRLEASE
ncbi:LPXTG cell wall anchor domain-containing protein [Catellatospora sp. KI3]|uniref:LPXTG cell wall anchor domain-containing protein n=1 Tax=Catellatospora sp. KI3 TaxID=3041620 RepID=UPI0024821D40|nr:LPXTG cell wall anchor domain-containing protein [Catellatospora sp. KI3]MDI1462856.1 LPXTG cell wall anchor domain-containing protein [Catellatospora sp. KI3]